MKNVASVNYFQFIPCHNFSEEANSGLEVASDEGEESCAAAPRSTARRADQGRNIASLALTVNTLQIRTAININIEMGCWNQSGPFAEAKALKAASSYGTTF